MFWWNNTTSPRSDSHIRIYLAFLFVFFYQNSPQRERPEQLIILLVRRTSRGIQDVSETLSYSTSTTDVGRKCKELPPAQEKVPIARRCRTLFIFSSSGCVTILGVKHRMSHFATTCELPLSSGKYVNLVAVCSHVDFR
ncbi:hypothetical protein TNCV_2109661 [Trichonephila clavipes]|nr:hypothetical protein TNCV_2109661 [Trichonephila clavipes]